MTRFLYYLSIHCYVWGIRLAALFGKEKAKKWWQGRRGWQEHLKQSFANNSAPVLWVHCASLGEFEQGRPLLEALRQKAPSHKILLTFFSPSGYERQKEYALADWVCYLPADQYGSAKKFIELVQPQQVFFIKYEFWYGYLSTLQQKNIPVYLIAAHFRPNQIFFRPYGSFFRKMLFCFQTIFVQTHHSQQLLLSLGHPRVIVVGDTRLDRVLAIKKQNKYFPKIEQFCKQAPTLIAGSTWEADEKLLAEWLHGNPNYQLLIAPHELYEKQLQNLTKRFDFAHAQRYSHGFNPNTPQTKVLIVDTIGMLSQLYGFGAAAYIGGGFGAGIHNCLEAVVYELPLFFGPNYKKFEEAKILVAKGIATEVHNAVDLTKGLNQFTTTTRTLLQQKVKKYTLENQGATALIIKHLPL